MFHKVCSSSSLEAGPMTSWYSRLAVSSLQYAGSVANTLPKVFTREYGRVFGVKYIKLHLAPPSPNCKASLNLLMSLVQLSSNQRTLLHSQRLPLKRP